ncbi:universal stress protein [Streptomyces sp. BH097]|uniref:universal stress protein n=1 Tax=unclassified Streptomyces TaxID=2593676 RepID=UPI003BB6F9B1
MTVRCVVVGVDGSVHADAAAEWAAEEALLTRAVLRVVHAGMPGAADQSARTVRKLSATHPAPAVDPVHTDGPPVRRLLEQARDADLLVLGVHGAGLRAGSVARAVAERCPGPVVLVPVRPSAEASRLMGRIAVGVDAPHPAERALEFAFERARDRATGLRAIRAWKPPVPTGPLPPLEADRATWEDQEVQSLSDTLRPWEEKYPEVRVLEDVVLLPPERALLLASERARLLVVGRRGQRLGPATTRLLAGTRAAVAVVPE